MVVRDQPEKKIMHLPTIVGAGYSDFWHFQGRYCIVKGSRASKKSKTTALWHIVKMMQFPESNTLVIRKVFRTLENSCYSDLIWAIRRLGVEQWWHISKSPLQLTYIPTGQKILFRGLDDPLKVTSISVDVGALTFAWLEELYEITREEDFDILDESIRGAVAAPLFKRITGTMNPWNEKHFVKRRFFDTPNTANKLALSTTYECNEFLDDADRAVFEDMKIRNPKRYRVAGLAEWGVIEGLVYDNFEERSFDIEALRRKPGIKSGFGLDFGYTVDPSSLVCMLLDEDEKNLYVFDELYEKGLTNQMLAKKIIGMGYGKEVIHADAAEPKSIDELREAGLTSAKKCTKGSIMFGIQKIQNYKIIYHPRCVNFGTEINLYQMARDRFGVPTGAPEDENNHAMDAFRYGFLGIKQPNLMSF